MIGRTTFDDFCNRINPRARTGEPLVPDVGPNLPIEQLVKVDSTSSWDGAHPTGEDRMATPTTQAIRIE